MYIILTYILKTFFFITIFYELKIAIHEQNFLDHVCFNKTSITLILKPRFIFENLGFLFF